MICKYCAKEFDKPEIRASETIHAGGSQHCPYCQKFLGWARKENNIDKRPKNRLLPEDLGIDYCEICLRKKHRLGKNETLDSHHKIEIQNGGLDGKENILVVCTHCHSLIRHVRCYMNDHFGDLWEEYERLKNAIEQKELTSEEYEEEISKTIEDMEKAPWE